MKRSKATSAGLVALAVDAVVVAVAALVVLVELMVRDQRKALKRDQHNLRKVEAVMRVALVTSSIR
jgi:hypothetical protein